jgi:serine protease Do
MNRMRFLLPFLLLLLAATSLLAQEGETAMPRSSAEIALSFAPVIKKVAPAVVNIYTRTVVKQRLVHPFMSDPFFREFFGDDFPQGLSRGRLQSSLGSGVIVREDGLVVTNNHVIAGADKVIVVLSDRREYEADILSSDKRTDIAILRMKTKGERFPTLTFRDSDTVNAGDLVLAIGNPFGVGQTVTMGIVSAVARAAEVSNSDVNYFIQTDAAINPGNSGGALVGADGKLVGVPSAIYSRDGGSLGIGFAIPSNLVRAVLASVKKDGRIERGWLGLTGQSLTAELAQSLGIARPSGVLIKTMHPTSPARASGLKVGDIILAVNDREVVDFEALRFRIATAPIGSVLKFKVLRDSETADVGVSLIAPPENPPRNKTVLKGTHPLAGVTVANLSPALVQEAGLAEDASGILVIAIDSASPANMIGLRKGDIILGVNNKEVPDVDSLRAALATSNESWRIALRRDDQVMTLAVRR